MGKINIIKKSILRLKKYLKEEENIDVKRGIYMSLQSIKNDLSIEDEDLIKFLELDEDLEKYL